MTVQTETVPPSTMAESESQNGLPTSEPTPPSSESVESKKEDEPKESKEVEQIHMDHPLDDYGEMDMMQWSSGYYAPDRKLSLNERIKQAPTRIVQANMWNRLLHDRLEALEEQMRNILKLPDPDLESKEETLPDHELNIKRLNWQDFSLPYDVPETKGEWTHRPEISMSPQSTIEVLVEEPQLSRVARFMFGPPPIVGGGKAVNEDTEVIIPVYQVRIRSPILLKVLNEITDQLVTMGPYKHQVVFLKPFKLLATYHMDLMQYQKKLEEIHANHKAGDATDESAIGPLKETQSFKALEHLRLLNHLIERDLSPMLRIREKYDEGALHRVAYSDLWHIFRPGIKVCTPGGKQTQMYRVIRVTGGRPILNTFGDAPENYAASKLKDQGYSHGSFVVECFYIDFDGAQYGPVNKTFQIRKFEGEKDILSLPIYPLHCDREGGKIEASLLERGKRFAVLSNPRKTAHMQYRGLTLDKHPEQVESQVIIDFELAFIEMSDNKPVIGLDYLVGHDKRETTSGAWRCNRCDREGCCGNDFIVPDYEIDQKEEQQFKSTCGTLLDATEYAEDLSDDQKALLPSRVYGFVLRSRKWATFDIDSISEVKYTDGWHNLVIDTNIRETVLAMVENHERGPKGPGGMSESLPSVDLVQGKGKGLIILLHGEPGVGKTSTAECVADHTKRPLFPITCGDIGDNAESVEHNLERNFQLAHKWGCVLLLDEADVFLKRRNDTDLTRNAIVSVFLRTLKYYSGILFLTTNRVGQIDRAFKSRIHVSLYYAKLDKKKSIKIWKSNINRIRNDFKREGRSIEIEEDEIVNFAKDNYKQLKNKGLLNWNGRQIRNAFQTAIALAAFDARKYTPNPTEIKLGRRQFVRVADAAEEFDKYLQTLSQGKNDSQLAKEHMWRLDDYEDEKMSIPVRPITDAIRPRAYYADPRDTRRSKKRRDVSSEDESESESSEEDKKDSDSESASTESSEEEVKKRKSDSKSKDGKKNRKKR